MPHGSDWAKAPPELADRFTATVSPLPNAQVRKMFGYPAGFVNGNLFTGLFAASWFVRLPEGQRAELTALGGGEFSPMPGRPMREYVVLPEAMTADAQQAEPWVRHALDFVSQLPPKAKR